MRKSILTTAIIWVATVSAFSQTATETRYIRDIAKQVYDNYKTVIPELYSSNPYKKDEFLNLFEKNAILYNDIIPANTPEQLSPAAYFENFQTNIKRIHPIFSDFDIEEPVSADNKWQIKIHFTRNAKFRTLTEMRYPEWLFYYSMTIEMDKEYDSEKRVFKNPKIVNIEVENQLKSFFIIENKEKLPLVTPSGEILNDWDEEYQSRIFPEDKWKIEDLSVPESNIFETVNSGFSQNETDTRFFKPTVQRFKKDILGLGINYTPFAWGNKIGIKDSVVNANDPIVTKHTSVLSLSFFYGKQIFHKNRSTLFANIGIDLNLYLHKFTPKNGTIHVETADVIYDVTFDSSVEKFTVFSLSVPLSIQYLHQLTKQEKKPVFLFLELGGFAEFATKKNNLFIEYAPEASATCHANIDQPLYNMSFKQYVLESKSIVSGGILGGFGLWTALNNSNLLKINFSYKCTFRKDINTFKDILSSEFLLYTAENGMHNLGFGILWVKIIGKNK